MNLIKRIIMLSGIDEMHNNIIILIIGIVVAGIYFLLSLFELYYIHNIKRIYRKNQEE